MRNHSDTMALRIALAWLLAAPASLCWGEEGQLKILVLEGEGAFNNIQQRLGRDLVVQVRDEQDRPVVGAEVVFTLPAAGPGASFPGTGRTFRAVTDAQGHAATKGLRPNRIEGRFNIKVTCSGVGKVGSTVVAQSNTSAGGMIGEKKGFSKKWLILLGVAGGATAGVMATRGGGTAPAPPISATLSPGTVTVGGPH